MTPKYVDSFDTILKKSARTPPHVAEKDPITYVIAIAAQELMRRPQDFKPQELKDSLWSLSRVRGGVKIAISCAVLNREEFLLLFCQL